MPELDSAALERLTAKVFARGRPENLIEVASPFSVNELIRGFENLRRNMMRLLNGLTEVQVNYSPDENTYSLSEVVSHLVAAQGIPYNAFLDIAASTLPHIDPVPRGPGAGAEKGLTGPVLQERLQKATNDLVHVLHETYNPSDEKIMTHPIFGKASHRSFMLFQLLHDLDHLKQAQAVRRTPGFPRKQS